MAKIMSFYADNDIEEDIKRAMTLLNSNQYQVLKISVREGLNIILSDKKEPIKPLSTPSKFFKDVKT